MGRTKRVGRDSNSTGDIGVAEMTPSLPVHGPICCRRCWPADQSGRVYTTPDEKFRVVNDPGAWGASNPRILVLGISKGFTQAREYERGDFNAVPFKDCRERLELVLQSVGLLHECDSVDARMSATEETLAWGSVVRCSLSGWNSKKGEYRAGTPEVLPAFRHQDARHFLSGCMRTFLSALPDTTKTVVLLGNDDRYIQIMRRELTSLFSGDCVAQSAVSHRADGRIWIHVAHPSRGNGHFGQFVNGPAENGQGLKRQLAMEAVRSAIAL